MTCDSKINLFIFVESVERHNPNHNPYFYIFVGISMRWLYPPASEMKAETDFNVTYELVVDASFYTWAYTNGYFDTSGPTASGFG